MSDENRTEQPTQKRRDDARKKGQMARSRDLAVAAASVAAAMMLGRLGSRLISGLADELAKDLHHFGDAPLRVVTCLRLYLLTLSVRQHRLTSLLARCARVSGWVRGD